MKNLISFEEDILIAGASGLAGSAIYRCLKKKGYGSKEYDGLILTPSRSELNLLSFESVNNWFIKNKPSIVIIAAAKVGGIFANTQQPGDFILENLKIQTNLIEASWRNGVRRLLFLGSSCIYPKHAEQPIKEEYLLQGPLETTNEAYALAKIAGLKLCESLRKQYQFDAISLMPTNLFGLGDNYNDNTSHVMAALIKKFCEAKIKSLKEVICWGSGNPLREFLYVDDLGDAVVFALEKWDPKLNSSPTDKKGDPLFHLNVGTGKEISIRKLAELIASLCEYKGKIIWDLSKPDGTPRKLLNIDKITNLGWNHKTSLEDGIRKTINFYLKSKSK